MERLNFKTSAEMFDAGYAIPLYGINGSLRVWRFRDEEYETDACSCQTTMNHDGIPLARIEDVRANAL